MSKEQIKNILAQLADHEARISALDGRETDRAPSISTGPGNRKQKTLREIVKGRKFKNGQEQIAVIVGYHERVIGTLINKDNLRIEWTNAKMTNKYSTKYISRTRDILVRVSIEGVCDLTQTGEDFFDDFLKNEPTNTASK